MVTLCMPTPSLTVESSLCLTINALRMVGCRWTILIVSFQAFVEQITNWFLPALEQKAKRLTDSNLYHDRRAPEWAVPLNHIYVQHQLESVMTAPCS